MTIQPATSDDLKLVVSLTRATRRRLAEWAPVYFCPAAGADEGHAGFLAFMIGSDDYSTRVLVADGETVGFFVEVAQGARIWIDDLCVTDEALWPAAVDAITKSVAAPWSTCVASLDATRTTALLADGLRVISSYWARSTDDVSVPAPPHEPSDAGELPEPGFDPANAAFHTFGGQAFQPDVPGVLVVTSSQGYAIGSPSVTPPIYDPGGPTTIIDQITGPDRRELLQQALTSAAARADAQVVVVCAEADSELEQMVAEASFDHVVNLIGI